MAYYNKVTHEVVIANRGTDLSKAPLKNLLLSDREVAGSLPEQVQHDAAAFALQVMDVVAQKQLSYTSVIETGHSLGGNEAQAGMVSLVKSGLSNSIVSGVGFNSPGIGGYPVPEDPSSYNFVDL